MRIFRTTLIVAGTMAAAAQGIGARDSSRGPTAAELWHEVRDTTEVSVPADRFGRGVAATVHDDVSHVGTEVRHDYTIHLSGACDYQQVLRDVHFISPQDSFQLAIVDLTGDGVDELLTIAATGRTGEPRERVFHVWSWCGALVGPVFTLVVYGESDEKAWWYEVSFIDLNGDGTKDIELTRADSSNIEPSSRLGLYAVPQGRLTAYEYDPKSQSFRHLDSDRLTSSNNGVKRTRASE